MKKANKTIILEGLIGIGKSHFAKELTEVLGSDTLYFDEPTNENKENPYLDDYYKDPKRWAYTMQTHLLQRRYRAHLESQWHVMNGKGHAVMDRSFYGDVVFANVQKEDGFMTATEYDSYLDLYHCMTANVLYPNVCIILDAPLDTIVERIKVRNRSCECSIPIDYLSKLQSNICTMAEALQIKGTEVIKLDWSVNRPNKEDRLVEIQKVADIVNSVQSVREYSRHFTSRLT